MIDWDAEPDHTLPPLEQLHAEAAAICARAELRAAQDFIDLLLWHYEKRLAEGVAKA